MQIESMFDKILEGRINEILILKEIPKEFKSNTDKLHFPLGCCCHNCIKKYNPIKSGEPIYFLYPQDKRKIGVIRACCVATYVEIGGWKKFANA
ncbi:MAG: hypothetical protein AABW88_03625 [Nanoarchaeota archaeon]